MPMETSSVQINISARHGHLSTGTQEKISDKVESIRRLFDRITAIQVVVDLEHRDEPSVEIKILAEHHDEFVATVKAENVLTALDGVIDKVEAQVRKFKERLKDHKATGHKHLEAPLPEIAEDEAE
ncbi:Ribosome hibernation promoting factor [Anatilimnocola aggregata]|uniref:Ribosome hibernation promoting factor n=1 Tax=Anatilimnocola aggregata TaxID=2528021 RepID=A0A517YK32_9BACT|nr:ribosome-associated translation inhibitor RaiA [Anatilimnocola aggregata]QDU30588.1 Ribosome hibernation promoting factor [Anatilimnocola aggregata]